jgi:hypothetical protein
MKKLRSSLIFPAVFLLTSLFLCGCAGTQGIDWDKRIGNYSYDDMRGDYGQPWKTQIAADGFKTCDWPVYVRVSWQTHTGYDYTYGRDYFPITDQPNASGGVKYFYRMTFDAKGLLTKWEKIKR